MIMRKSAICTLNNSLPHKGTEGTKEYILYLRLHSEKRFTTGLFISNKIIRQKKGLEMQNKIQMYKTYIAIPECISPNCKI